MLDAPHCLHWLLILLRSQMLDLPHYLQLGLLRLCSQMLDPRAALLAAALMRLGSQMPLPPQHVMSRNEGMQEV